jgi:hypothetical protein
VTDLEPSLRNQKKFDFPWYVLVVALIFPTFLYLNNLSQVNLRDLWRPMVVTSLSSLLIYALVYIFLRNFNKAGLITVLLEIFIFTYGHVYNLLRTTKLFGLAIGRHRYLLIVFLLLFGILIWLVWTRIKKPDNLIKIIKIISVSLLLFQVVRITYYEISSAIIQYRTNQVTAIDEGQFESSHKRDIYLIVLDTYMRSDLLEMEHGYDNSDFIPQLEDLGFFIADCSRSNYAYTLQSMTSELNLDYLSNLGIPMKDEDLSAKLKQSQVRYFLQNQGYEFIFFESGYPWIEMEDADQYIQARTLAKVTDFEYLYLRTTLLLFPSDIYKMMNESIDATTRHYIDRVNNTINRLKRPIKNESPVFVYAHIVSPHNPKVFTRTGGINLDWDNDPEIALTETYEYINTQIISVIETILSNSDSEPIIILQADHGDGYDSQFRTLILNAYYLPDGGEGELYSTITPVNTFRIIFDRYFGQDYPLLDDRSYFSPEKDRYNFELVNEPYDYCQISDEN